MYFCRPLGRLNCLIFIYLEIINKNMFVIPNLESFKIQGFIDKSHALNYYYLAS